MQTSANLALALGPVDAAAGRRVLIHAGLPKTATTTLQRHLFAVSPGIHHLGIPGPTPDLDWAVHHLVQADSTHLDAARLRAVFEDAIAPADPSRLVLLSYENILGYEAKDKGLVAARLKALFPHAEVVIVLRRQQDLVTSRYLNDMRKLVKRKLFQAFEEWFANAVEEPHRSVLDDLRYGAFLDWYAASFGCDRMHVLLFEELQRDMPSYAAKWAKILGLPAEEVTGALASNRENATISQGYLDFWAGFGRLLPRRIAKEVAMKLPRHRGQSAQIEFSKSALDHIARLCGEDNRRIADAYGLDLDEYGYLLEG